MKCDFFSMMSRVPTLTFLIVKFSSSANNVHSKYKRLDFMPKNDICLVCLSGIFKERKSES